VLIAVEGREAVHERPHVREVGVEDVRAVEVDFDVRRGVDFAAAVPANGGALFEDEDALPRLREPPRDRAAPDPRPGDDCVMRPASFVSVDQHALRLHAAYYTKSSDAAITTDSPRHPDSSSPVTVRAIPFATFFFSDSGMFYPMYGRNAGASA